MQNPPRLLALLAIAPFLPAAVGCRHLQALHPPEPPAPPMALLTEGSAFTAPGARERVGKAVRKMTGRQVLLVDRPTDRDDPRRAVVAQLSKGSREFAAYDWKEPRCAAERPVLAALTSNADAVYRVVLDVTDRQRRATQTDLESAAVNRNPLQAALAAFRDRDPEMVHEESVVGSVAVSVFAKKSSPPHVRVERHATRLDGEATALAIPAIVAAALRDLPLPQTPDWEAYIRRLLASGCPLLALTVAEARLGSGKVPKNLKATALAAMRRSMGRRPVRQRAAASEPAGTPPAEGLQPTVAPSCTALCGMHMVELCNNDRALWIAHRARWETTPCGTRRPEPFLEECYRQQWLSGTFENACVIPCERAKEGRQRLESILRRAKCLPGAPPAPSTG